MKSDYESVVASFQITPRGVERWDDICALVWDDVSNMRSDVQHLLWASARQMRACRPLTDDEAMSAAYLLHVSQHERVI